MVSEFRLYGQPNCNIFDLIGTGETDQTKSLGYLLGNSHASFHALIRLINRFLPNEKYNFYLPIWHDYIIDCELRQNLNDNKSYRADIVTRIYGKGNKPLYAIVIEAKCKGKKITEENAVNQIKRYSVTFEELIKPFKDKVVLVTLTDTKTIAKDSDVISITWCDLMSALDDLVAEPLAKEYVEYLLKINGNMKQYDKEVLSIPAGGSQEIIKETSIYTCPASASGRFKTRAESHPLYMACREKGSIIRELYKIQDVIQLTLPLDEEIKPYLIDTYGSNIIDRLKPWYPEEEGAIVEKNVFIFDPSKTIKLPRPVKLANGNTFDKELSLYDVFNDAVGCYDENDYKIL